jgi:hypothetical protein
MIEVGMGKYDGIKLGERMDFRDIQVGDIGAVVRFFTTINKYPALRSGEKECSPADLPAAPEGCDPHPLVLAGDIPVNPPSDGPEKLFSFLIYGP